MFIKIVQTKHIIEVYEYEHLNVNPEFPDEKCDPGDSCNVIENYAKRNQIRRDAIRRLAIENFDISDKFLTLTFRDNEAFDIKDVKQCNAEYEKFIKRLKRLIKKLHPALRLKYLAVIEFQDKNDRGAVHYHVLLNIPYLPHEVIEKVWGLGFISVNRIDHVDNLGAYVIKYMTPNMDDPRLMGLKAYNCSTGLERPKVLKSWKVQNQQELEAILATLPKEKVVYSAKYKTENAGRIAYSQVNLKRKLPK